MTLEDGVSAYASERGAGELTIVDEAVDETVGIREYSVTSYGIDYDINGYVRRLQQNDIVIPGYQRKYVWDQKRASRFIESLLLDLPVPGVFLYRDQGSETQLVVDGQQRLQSLRFFYEGVFPNTNKAFKLTGLETRFNGQAYSDLDIADRRRLDNSFIRATVIHQVKPDNDATSQYYVFERLNTGGVALASQEIRAAIYGGELNELLAELNANENWRKLFGKANTDRRKRDEELILRFIALYFSIDTYARPMKGFLNRFMKENRALTKCPRERIMPVFENTVRVILEQIGEDAFKPTKSLNAAMLDSIMVGVARRLQSGEIKSEMRGHVDELRKNEQYLNLISSTTSDPARVRLRLQMATEAFAALD